MEELINLFMFEDVLTPRSIVMLIILLCCVELIGVVMSIGRQASK